MVAEAFGGDGYTDDRFWCVLSSTLITLLAVTTAFRHHLNLSKVVKN